MTTQSLVRKGSFIVIEGTDGSGKGTQFELLANRLTKEGYQVETFDFPQYSEDSSYFIKKYLNGEYGTMEKVGPYTGSIFYALDRYQAATKIQKALDAGKVVLANRFTGSNMAHQGAKFDNKEERLGYFIWLDNLEFQILNIPRPDKSFILRVPAYISQALVDKKPQRAYTNKKRDLHEADIDHLEKSVEVYDDLCQLFPKDFARIDCVRDRTILHIEVIHDMLWKTIEPLLPPKLDISAESPNEIVHTKITNPYLEKQLDGSFVITEEGNKFLGEAVTNTEGSVYGFYDKLSPMTIAAAMARLSRRSDDMRVTILDEFTNTSGKDTDLLRRVITAYGDDSVQQLAGQHIVVEGASNLLTKQIEWGRLASYLEQSTRYIYYDKKDANGKYSYFVPSELDENTTSLYVSASDKIFDLYSIMVRKLTEYITAESKTAKSDQDPAWRSAVRAQACDVARMALPVSAKSTVGIYASGQALEHMIMRLKASPSLEARQTAESILVEARKTIPIFLERADKPDRGGAMTAYFANTRRAVAALADKLLPETYGYLPEAVTLVRHWPINEIDLVPHMLYEHSSMSLADIKVNVDKMSIDEKITIFETYMGERLNRRQKPGRAMEQARYTWDLVCDYGIFRDLQRHRMVDDLQWQQLSPRYGYDIPELINEAGLSETYEKCFDLSFQLYGLLQASGYYYEAQYATLLGHKMRWTVTYNARQAFHLHEIRTTPQGHPGYRKLVKQMHQILSEKHPMIGEAMKFVNHDEDPELTRLAAERATQYKLETLDQ